MLYTIQYWLGGIGNVRINEKDAVFMVTSKQDTNKLLKLMYNYFSKLNTTKVLDFVDWYKGRNLYYKYLDQRDISIPAHKDPTYPNILKKIIHIKNYMNKSRINFKLPESHEVSITNEWLLGFFEGEGCFYLNNTSIAFNLPQTAVNRYVLVYIKDYLKKYRDNLTITIKDCRPNKLKQKPYSVLFIGNNNANAFISLLINLPWLSIKLLNFTDWVIIHILVSEGKHFIPEGKDIIAKLKSRLGTKRELLDKEIGREVIDLLYSESNYIKSDHTGILKVKKNLYGLPSIKHKTGSYVLVTDPPQKKVGGKKWNF